MDIQEAKKIIHCLAEGVDPLTGEVLPATHLCNKPEIINALLIAQNALTKDLNRPEDGTWHKEFGKVWSKKEITTLLYYFERHYTVAQISEKIGRSDAAIRAKLVRLGKISRRRDAK